ncbi:MAG TPA: glycine radical domain-containing protein, partial [Planctomycetota bacterium]|nr:glycine radical domain-containing protein [Planctomycetota bacterium]
SKYSVYPDGGAYVPGMFCWVMHEVLGRQCGATPDGRRAGFPFADGGGPAQGREKNGPTAAILSTTSWDHSCMIGGLAYNMKFDSSLFASQQSRDSLRELVLTFLRRGGFETQINVVSREKLEQARRNPEQYRDLVVRIGGYTDYFARLSPEMQEEVMMRTEYEEM